MKAEHLKVSQAFLVLTLSIIPVTFRGVEQHRGWTSRLPPIDKVELQQVEGRELWISRVEKTKTIDGIEARAIAGLWRAQKWNRGGYSCHFPVYAIKFFSHDKLIFYASICWECHNVYFIEPNSKELVGNVGFAADAAKGRELLKLFRKHFG